MQHPSSVASEELSRPRGVANAAYNATLRERARVPSPPAPEDSPAVSLLSLPLSLFPPLCHCVKDFSANIRAGERLESIRNRSAKASSEGVRCRTRHRPLDLRRHVVVTAEEKDRSQPWGPLEPWIKTLDGSAGKCDVLCSTCC